MIFMRSGKTGSGKSFDAVKLSHEFWKSGMNIWSNTPLFFTTFNSGIGGENIIDNPELFSWWERSVFNLKKVFKKNCVIPKRGKINYFDTIDETFYIKDALILFDEGQTAFRNYDWESIPRLFLYKLEQNRKHGLHLVTTAQRVKAVNINYRELIQDWSHFETILDFAGFHIYRIKIKDVDYITENMQEQEVPDLKIKGLFGLKILTPWTTRLYDTFYDIGFEPLQEYQLFIDGENITMIIESGASVKEIITKIRTLKGLNKLVYG